jgi:hypothetical protein
MSGRHILKHGHIVKSFRLSVVMLSGLRVIVVVPIALFIIVMLSVAMFIAVMFNVEAPYNNAWSHFK